MRFRTNLCKKFSVIYLACLIQSSAMASTSSNLPFVSTMDKLKQAITGQFLTSIAIIMIVVTCFMLAFAEMGEGMRKVINIVLWLSVAFGASSFVTSLFGTGAVF